MDKGRVERKQTRAELDRSLIHGIAWTSAVTWLSQVLSWGATFFVVHHLTTADYGLVGMAALYLGVVQMLSEFGLGSAVVRFQSLSDDQVAQFNSLSVAMGFAAFLVSLLAAFPIGRFFGELRLPSVIAVMSLAFVISSFKVVPQAVMQRALQFRKLALLDGAQSIAMASASMTMAALGFGYWTLALGPLVGAAVFTLLVVVHKPTPFRRPQMESIRRPFKFSRQTIATRFAWFGYSNADFLVIGKMLGKDAMGAYYLGWTISGMAVEKVTALVGRVTGPFLATVQRDLPELRRYLLIITEGLSLLTFPACIGLALIADDLVRALGPQWTSATVPLQLLAILATVRSIDPLVQQVLSAIGAAHLNLQNAILTLCILPPAFVIAADGWGLTGVAITWLVLGPLMFSRLLLQALGRIGLSPRQYFGSLLPAVSGCLVMAGGVVLADRMFLGTALLYQSLGVKVLVGAGIYVATLFVLHRDRLMMVRDAVRVLRSRQLPQLPPENESAIPGPSATI